MDDPVGLSSRLAQAAKLAKFRITQAYKKFDIQTTPHFDTVEGTEYFLSLLEAAAVYIEFGSGGSTYQAALKDKQFVAIDTDNVFLRSVRQKIIDDGLFRQSKQKYVYRDIGPTTVWGAPAFRPPLRRATLTKFEKSSDYPLDDIQTGNGPILTLVDGRFRAACALKTMKAMKHQSDWCLVVDNYMNRPHLHEIEKVGILEKSYGTMAFFNDIKDIDDGYIDSLIDEYHHDWR